DRTGGALSPLDGRFRPRVGAPAGIEEAEDAATGRYERVGRGGEAVTGRAARLYDPGGGGIGAACGLKGKKRPRLREGHNPFNSPRQGFPTWEIHSRICRLKWQSGTALFWTTR